MRGIILAGGTGTRLHPTTAVSSKHLLPVYDKPMVYYPLSVLMLAEIRDILVISNPEHIDSYRQLLGNGAQLGLRLSYAVQEKPRGLADALCIGRAFIGDEQVALILGDNIFYGNRFAATVRREQAQLDGCTLFGHQVADPWRFGVATVDEAGLVTRLEEKPASPQTNIAVTGLYLYDNEAVELVTRLRRSPRGELEITDLNRMFVEQGRARLVDLGRGSVWFDAGTHESLMDAAMFVQVLAKRQGIRLACVEEVAYRMGYIDDQQLLRLSKEFDSGSDYGHHLAQLCQA